MAGAGDRLRQVLYNAKLVYFNKVARGGHFAAFEQPEIFTEELRTFGRLVR